ncbi:MAG: hypothetical protein IMZ47_07600 [Firmicutes bacterium]|nr:hypothetical protein [Bacillota bacterium]
MILMSLGKLEAGQTDLKLQFTNHLEHHRQDSIREVACLRKWIWVCIPTVITLFLAVVGAAYYLGRTN